MTFLEVLGLWTRNVLVDLLGDLLPALIQEFVFAFFNVAKIHCMHSVELTAMANPTTGNSNMG